MAGMCGATKVQHNFVESLAASHAAEDLPLWEEAYRAAFPGFQAAISHREDGPHQRAGIDRSVVLHNSKRITIDEKIRGTNKITGKVYDDISLEYWSVFYSEGNTRNQKGWVCKPLLCDYIAYAIAPLGVCYLLPTLQLRTAWIANGRDWVKSHHKVVAKNSGYQTISVAVPAPKVMQAIRDAHCIQFTPTEGF